jgi:hypothetical protein
LGRIQFIDELGTRGELPIEEVRIGDHAVFTSEFDSHEVNDTKRHFIVSEGTIGKVIDVVPHAPGLMVEAVGSYAQRDGSFESETQSMFVTGDHVALAIHSGDERLSNSRIQEMRVGLRHTAARDDETLWMLVNEALDSVPPEQQNRARAVAELSEWARRAQSFSDDLFSEKLLASVSELREMSDDMFAVTRERSASP